MYARHFNKYEIDEATKKLLLDSAMKEEQAKIVFRDLENESIQQDVSMEKILDELEKEIEISKTNEKVFSEEYEMKTEDGSPLEHMTINFVPGIKLEMDKKYTVLIEIDEKGKHQAINYKEECIPSTKIEDIRKLLHTYPDEYNSESLVYDPFRQEDGVMLIDRKTYQNITNNWYLQSDIICGGLRHF